MKKILIANRGEIALRIARTAIERGLKTVAVFAEEDAASRHLRVADEAVAIGKAGAAAYLDIDRLLEIARETGADAVHPGYGFLSENADFARACAQAGVRFIGPSPEVLSVFGDKSRARQLALHEGVPVARGTDAGLSLAQAEAFMKALGGPIMLKAVAGGGGRGMRAVADLADLEQAYDRCRSEALTAFGKDDLYAEQLIRAARHIEVQIIGDGTGRVTHLFERDCTLQRRHQKLIEIAPSPFLNAALRERLFADSKRLAAAVDYQGLGTVEFLVDGNSDDYIFIECNPRLQVEHTITEEITGLDLVGLQLDLAMGASLGQLNLPDPAWRPQSFALQARVNMEQMQPDAQAFPTTGTLRVFDLPAGPGIRVDTFGYAGYRTTGRFDSLLAKVIVRGAADFSILCARARHALQDFTIAGVSTNIDYLGALLDEPDLIAGRIDTNYVERYGAALYARAIALAARREEWSGVGVGDEPAIAADEPEGPVGSSPLRAPMQGTIIRLETDEKTLHGPSAVLAVLEAMKLEHGITAGLVGRFHANQRFAPGDVVLAGQVLGWLLPDTTATFDEEQIEELDLDGIRPDLAEAQARRGGLLDHARPAAVARRRKLGKQTVRENIAQLFDPDSFTEYGGLALAMQRGRRSEDELINMSPADGVITGLGMVNAGIFGAQQARCAVMAYDYTVFAGTQGFMGHRKMDRIVDVAERLNVPLVLFAEGGGGRPGDTDYVGASALEFTTFAHMARLSGRVPLIGIVTGRCFAGNAALLGCCDVIIATRDTSLGMAGPAMIEGGGLGRVEADDVGPVAVQSRNGVIDIVVADEAEAIRTAKRYLAFLQGAEALSGVADQRLLRRLVPENRKAGYDIRAVIEGLFDTGSFLELRREFGCCIVTGFARLEGRSIGLIANDGRHLGGAIDSPGADKAARFLELCDAYGLPVVTLCDTPGFMVGTQSETTAAVRHFARLFVTSAHVGVPILSVVLRKAYGLGAQAMMGGNLLAPLATVSWPTGELGPMGIEGAVRLAYRRELEALTDPQERAAQERAYVDALYRAGRALNVASYDEIDDVIDPAETRAWLHRMLQSLPPGRPGRLESGISPW